MVTTPGEQEATVAASTLQPPTIALSTALALQLPADSLSWLGTALDITVAPSASASQRIVEAGAQSIASQATAQGLGFGYSPLLPDGFGTPGLSVMSGGGSLTGMANAIASGVGNNEALVKADAVNIGIANTNFLSRSSQPLFIGQLGTPFGASASASSRSLLPTTTLSSELPAANLQAESVVRGLQGTSSGDVAPPIFYGQPVAFVGASADLNLDAASRSTATALADATGIEGYTIYGITNPSGPAGNVALTSLSPMIGGHAAIGLNLAGSAATTAEPLELSGNAIGIQQSTIYGAPRADMIISGSGVASLRSDLPAAQIAFSAPVQAIGINQSSITTGLGTTLIVGTGTQQSNLGNGSIPGAIVAGIADSRIIGQGNTIISGTTPNNAGFNGILNSDIVAATGTTSVLGTADATKISTAAANTQVRLDGASGLKFQGGGAGIDTISLGTALNNQLNTGPGNDAITIGDGGGNSIDAGFGQNLITSTGFSSSDTFVKSNAGASLDAANSESFAERLTQPAFWNSLTDAQKQDLWTTGKYTENGIVSGQIDSTIGFDPGAGGDTLALSSSLGSMTQSYWQEKGAVFGVANGKLQVIDGPSDSSMGVITGTLAEIRGLVGITGSSLAYATDTRQLMFDADGNWAQGSRSIGQLSMSDGDQLLKQNIKFA